MLLCASQRLWAPREEAQVLKLLPHFGTEGVAPLGHRMWPEGATFQEGLQMARMWSAGVRQADLQVPVLLDPIDSRDGGLFGPRAVPLFARLQGMVTLAAEMGAQTVVVGAPGLRRTRLPPLGSQERGLLYARLLSTAALAEQLGVVVGIKPVPETSGGLFWTCADDVQSVCDDVESMALRVVLDSGFLCRERAPRTSVTTYVGRSPVFIVSESFGGPITPSPSSLHRTYAGDLARFARVQRAPEWLVWEGDGPDTPRQVGPALRMRAHAVRCMYAEALQTPPSSTMA